MDKAVYGLIGVVLGVFLTIVKEWWFQSRKNKKEAEFLAIQIACMLDRFVAGCVAVAGDDGLCHGQPDENGYSSIQVDTPKFEPDIAKVEWKSLPASLMHKALSFPNKIEVANNRISAAFEYAATPPDYAEGFEERQLRYAELGIEASGIAKSLRSHIGLPTNAEEEWDPLHHLTKMKAYLLELQAAREAEHSAMVANLVASKTA
ncbi:MAG: hypothetical protein V4729_10255 [Pseudomonadota bacterium]